VTTNKITPYKGGRTAHVNGRITPAKKAVLVAEARRLDCTLSDLIEKLAQELADQRAAQAEIDDVRKD
jgi:hypothetical protein